MKKSPAAEAAKATFDEIATLVRQLDQTQRRIQELAGGELDSVLHPEGRAYLLHQAQEKLRESEMLYHSLFENMLDGCAYCQLIFEEGKAVDYMYVRTNRAFETQTSLKDVAGKKVSEVVPGMHQANPEQLEIYSRVARTGLPEQFETCARQMDIWFSVSAYSNEPEHFAVVFKNITQSKKAAEKLHADEALFRLFIQHAPAAIAMLDTQMRYLQVSERWIQDYHLTGQQIIGQSHYDIFPDAPQSWKDIHQRVLAGAIERCEEDAFPRADGSIEWLQWEARPWHEAGGRIGGLIFFTQVITERKLAEQTLKESEELARQTSRQLAKVLDSSQDVICTFDANGRFIQVSAACERVWGYRPDELLGTLFIDKVHPDDREMTLAVDARILSGRSTADFENRYVRKDGAVIHVMWSAWWSEAEQSNFCVAHDITERKKAEAKLAFNEQRFRSLVEATSEIVWDMPASGEFVVEQPGWGAFTGQTFEEYHGVGWLSAIHPDDQEETYRVWTAAVASRSLYKMEQRVRAQDGSDRNMTVRAVPVLGEDGEILQWIGIHTDITERKKAEASLVETSALLESLLENTEDYIYFKDLQSRIVHGSKRYLTHLRLTNFEEARGKSDFDFYLEPHAQAAFATERKIIQTGESVSNLEEKETHLDGRITWALTSRMPWRDPAGKLLGTVGISKDITGRKQAEELLMESQQRLALATESAQIGIWDWDVMADKMFWDRQMVALYGIAEKDFNGAVDAWHQGLHPEDRERAEAEIAAALKGEGDFRSEFRIIWPKGGVRYIEAHAVVKRREDGVAQRMIGVNWDVTERKTLEQQFLRAQRMEGIGTLAGGIAHDLNNVLAPIIMSIELLKMKFEDPSSQELLAIISSSAQRGADMVGQVLSFARGVEGRRLEVQLKQLLRDLEKLASDTFQKNIQIRSIVPNDLWTVIGDPTQLHQVLLNLCINARDAMPEGGTLTLSAENITLDAHYAALNLDASVGPFVILQVEDSGSGMPQAVVEKIFDPFFTTKALGKGTGLGLSTTMAIVKSHGGFVHVDSEIGKGTKFKVHLPATREKSEAAVAFEEADMPRGNGELILVVDDEPSVRQITQQTLEAFGYRVVLAADGTEAVAIYVTRALEISAVLTDIMMPLMDGPAMIRIFFKLNPDVRVIAASGLSAHSQIVELGVKHFLPKPYTAETLLKVLREVLTEKP